MNFRSASLYHKIMQSLAPPVSLLFLLTSCSCFLTLLYMLSICSLGASGCFHNHAPHSTTTAIYISRCFEGSRMSFYFLVEYTY